MVRSEGTELRLTVGRYERHRRCRTHIFVDVSQPRCRFAAERRSRRSCRCGTSHRGWRCSRPVSSAATGCAEGGAAAHQHSWGTRALRCGSGSTAVSPAQHHKSCCGSQRKKARVGTTEPFTVVRDSSRLGRLSTVPSPAARAPPLSAREQIPGPSLARPSSDAWLQGVAYVHDLLLSCAATCVKRKPPLSRPFNPSAQLRRDPIVKDVFFRSKWSQPPH